MPRPLSHTLLASLETAEDSLGVSLAKLCVKAGIPVLYLSAILGVSRMTLHSWFRGGNMNPSRASHIKGFMSLIEDDLQAGVLPKKTLDETKKYAESIIGKAISPANKKLG